MKNNQFSPLTEKEMMETNGGGLLDTLPLGGLLSGLPIVGPLLSTVLNLVTSLVASLPIGLPI